LKRDWVPALPFKDQPRYKASTACHMHEIFQGLNDWKLITLTDTKDSNVDKNDEVHELGLPESQNDSNQELPLADMVQFQQTILILMDTISYSGIRNLEC